jgi:group I intron endonuclease
MNSGIYSITNSLNGKVYIGSSSNLRRRKYNHWYQLKKGIHPNAHLQNACSKYGRDIFHFTVLEYCEPVCLLSREDFWISQLESNNPDKGYNFTGAQRREHTEETRAKISASRKGKCTGDKNPSKRPEVIAKLSGENNHFFGKSHTEESKAKISVTKIGTRHTEETKAKMSAAQKGNPNLGWAKGKSWTPARRAAQIERGKRNSDHSSNF